MTPAESLSRSRVAAWVGLLVAPYVLNDFANIYVRAPGPWLALDYSLRFFSLGCVAWCVRRGVVAGREVWPSGASMPRVMVAGVVAICGGLLLNTAAARAEFRSLSP